MAWPIARKLLRRDPTFARDLWSHLDGYHDSIPTKMLLEQDACDLFQAIHDALPMLPEPCRSNLETRAGAILEEVAVRRTIRARDSLRALTRRRRFRELRIVADAAELLTLAESWRPPAPRELTRKLRRSVRTSAIES
jgi:hypothetical protein